MGTSYEEIYDNVLPKLRSWEIPLMSEEQVKECLHDYLAPAIVRFHVCRKDLSDRDDVKETFNMSLSDMEIEILSNYLLIEYIDSEYIRTPTLLKSSLSSSDFNAFSSANMLDKLMAMHKTYLSENDVLLSRYAWFSYKDGGISLSTGYKKKNSSGNYESSSSNIDVPTINVGSTLPGKPFSEPLVKDVWSGDDVILDFVIPTAPEFKVKQVNTISPDERASVVIEKNVEEGTLEAVFNIPQGQKGNPGDSQDECVPIDNKEIDIIFKESE